MKVCITEKPSVARDIAAILGAREHHDGYFEGNGYCVTWTFGHLCCLKDPGDYQESWKRWSISQLPMIPQRFGIKLIDQKSYKQQFAVIRSLIEKADEVINCGDAGQEGELIQRWVMQHAGIKCPVSRLWISSLTDESIRQGFSELKPEKNFDNLYYAGLSRAIGDWILGINGTRLYTQIYSQSNSLLSVGRVQTPTLALVVQRQQEIDNFKSENFWELYTIYRDITFRGQTERFSDADKAKEIAARIKGDLFRVTDVEKKKGRETPPRLFDLTSLQVECNKIWGWSADKTLGLIQSLYEKKVTTYPRVDTTYLTDDLYVKIPGILQKMTPYAPLTQPLLEAPIIKPKRIFDNAKVTDHHAIIPTGQSPASLVGDEKLLYHLIARRFIAAFYPDCIFTTTAVIGTVSDIKFKANGKVIESEGWRAIYSNDAKDNTTDDDAVLLPDFTVGESGPHKPAVKKKETQPPKYYTEGTLLRAMESAGKTVEDEELREALRVNGIGRPSTRAKIIETLYKRGYIAKKRKSIIATEAGKELIATISDELLKSAKLTGIWENKLRRIESGDYSAADFISELKQMIHSIVKQVLSDNSHRKIDVNASKTNDNKSRKAATGTRPATKRIRKIEDIVCPKCKQGHILKGKAAYGCSRFREGCDYILPFDSCPSDITPGKLNRLIQKDAEK